MVEFQQIFDFDLMSFSCIYRFHDKPNINSSTDDKEIFLRITYIPKVNTFSDEHLLGFLYKKKKIEKENSISLYHLIQISNIIYISFIGIQKFFHQKFIIAHAFQSVQDAFF